MSETINDSNKREMNQYGRLKNARNSDFKFVAQSVLRIEEEDKNKDKNKDKGKGPGKNPGQKKNINDLVNALSKGSVGGIGPFEINMLDWISKLRFVSTNMILDLVRGGYVSTGWRQKISKDKLADIIKRMRDYDLVNTCRFYSVDDNGIPLGNASVTRIMTLGRAGNTMLHELGREDARFNSFDVYQDGNTVKKYLTSNQWLIYWLTTYPEAIDSFDTTSIVYQKGTDFEGARFYASVTVKGVPMVAEPIRRVDDFEKDRIVQAVKAKYERFLSLFSNLDQLYKGQEKLEYPARPILVYVCEDDEHIAEVYNYMRPLFEEHPEQQVWFTADLRVYNYEMSGKRFLTGVNGALEVVNSEVYEESFS